MKKMSGDQVLARINCNDWIPQRQVGHTGWQTWAQPWAGPSVTGSADGSQRVLQGCHDCDSIAKGK